MTSPLISAADLAVGLGDPLLRIIDASWHLDGRDADAEYLEARIPGAVRFDLDAASDHDNPLPHMLPSPEAFARVAGAMGVGRDDRIVVYDAVGIFSAPRAWWTFRLMGAGDVRVLDGGLPRWRAEGRPIETGPAPSPAPAVFEPRPRRQDVADMAAVMSALTGDAQVVDARPAARFRGEAPEPRPGLHSGHMPGAMNLPFKALLTSEGQMLRDDALAGRFSDAGIDLDRPIVTTCGSGVSAAILTLALAELERDSRLYDGSWAEWGGREDTPVVTG